MMPTILLIAGIVGICCSLVSVFKLVRFSRFPTTQGCILTMRIAVVKRRGVAYRPEITYRYAVQQSAFTSDRLFSLCCGRYYASRPAAERACEGLAANATVPVSYDPANPRFSFVRNGPLFMVMF